MSQNQDPKNIDQLISEFSFQKSGFTFSAKAWQKALLISLLTWLPLAIASLLTNEFFYTSGEITFVKDFEIHVRFLFVVPLFVLLQEPVTNYFRAFFKTTQGRLDPDSWPDLADLIRKGQRMISQIWPDILIVIMVYALAFLSWDDAKLVDTGKGYLIDLETGDIRFAGYYYLLISFPIFQLLIVRWLGRWFMWVYTLAKMNKLPIRIDVANVDLIGGLTYLSFIPFMFSFVFLGFSAVVSVNFGLEIAYHGAKLSDYYFHTIAYILIITSLIYSPLLLFMPKLSRSRFKAIHRMGNFVSEHNQAFENKWINKGKQEDEDILGSADPSSMADLGGSYDPVLNMKAIPINYRIFVTSCGIIFLPFIPLIFTKYSLQQLIEILSKAVMG